ncbi:MAG: hypothetical protein ACLPQS_06285 [Acidimicrobiales bacterium]
MQLSSTIEGISDDLRRAGAVGGDDTRRIAELLVSSVETSIRVHLLDALHEAARELSDSFPGADVEIRLEGRDPVLTLVIADQQAAAASEGSEQERMAGYADDELARLTLRLPEGLKGQIENVASRAGASLNSWVVSALARTLETPMGSQPGRRMPRRMTGYVQG